jgi:hypothetical protein
VATVEQLKTQLDAIAATETAEASQITTLGTALHQIITMLQAEPAVPDALVQQATDIAASAVANTAAATGLATEASGALPPTP